jgi:hypothetical protein
MKKKIVMIAGAFALLIGAGAVFMSAQNDKLEMSSLMQQNIEAIGQTESKNYSCCEPFTGHCETEGSQELPGVKKSLGGC